MDLKIIKDEIYPKTGLAPRLAFILITILTLVAVLLGGILFRKIVFTENAATREFAENISVLLASIAFILGAIIYLYIKGLLPEEYVTTVD